jgi:thymidylate synthase ThyX
MSSTPAHTSAAPTSKPTTANDTDVFAVHGADPEVLAYAMAKYSRSSLSMKESLREISTTRAEQFLNTFYFQYGHRSIADLAHLAFAIERLSLAAAITLVDEQRWDGQERSTRYQNFRKSGWYTPDLGAQTPAYTSAIEALFAGYDRLSAGMFDALTAAISKPAEMDEAAYKRTLKARAFDVARYLLPLATNTSLGQIVNARTLEMQVSRLLSHPLEEVRSLGEKLRHAAATDAWNVQHESLRVLTDEITSVDATLGAHAKDLLLREVRTAPTLVKYAAPNEYEIASRAELAQAAAELMQSAAIATTPCVDLVEPSGTLEIDLAAALLYPHCHYGYRQLRDAVAALPAARRDEIVSLGAQHRGRHDELARGFRLGAGFTFDILMDIGGFRDMHRHRRCVQLMQNFTSLHGYDLPDAPGQPTLAATGLLDDYNQTIAAAYAAYQNFSPNPNAQYLLPLATRCRSLFQMDFAEAVYISELRSGVAGHYSYRRIAWEMYLAVQHVHPALGKFFRINDVTEPVDLLQR